MKPRWIRSPSPSRRRATATNSRCAWRRGDTVRKMLDDVGVPDADRKEIAEELKAPEEEQAGSRRDHRAPHAGVARAPDAPRVLSLLGAAAARAGIHHHP